MANPVTWFEIIGNDPIANQKFYADVFGWQLTPPVAEMGNYSMLMNHGEGIGGGIGGTMGGPQRVTVYIQVDDPDAYLAKVEAAGGKTLMPTMQVTPDTTIAMFADPEGHVIGLLKAT
jgi:predicted enzyme related to lactoylglutathione lyase